jgi:hypothetical protein
VKHVLKNNGTARRGKGGQQAALAQLAGSGRA